MPPIVVAIIGVAIPLGMLTLIPLIIIAWSLHVRGHIPAFWIDLDSRTIREEPYRIQARTRKESLFGAPVVPWALEPKGRALVLVRSSILNGDDISGIVHAPTDVYGEDGWYFATPDSPIVAGWSASVQIAGGTEKSEIETLVEQIEGGSYKDRVTALAKSGQRVYTPAILYDDLTSNYLRYLSDTSQQRDRMQDAIRFFTITALAMVGGLVFMALVNAGGT